MGAASISGAGVIPAMQRDVWGAETGTLSRECA